MFTLEKVQFSRLVDADADEGFRQAGVVLGKSAVQVFNDLGLDMLEQIEAIRKTNLGTVPDKVRLVCVLEKE